MMKLGKDTGSLVNHMYSRLVNTPTPEVGLGVTLLGWTDRYPGTIIEVGEDWFCVREDDAIRTDKNGMSESQEYEFVRNSNRPTYTFRKCRRGKAKGQWRENGSKDGRQVLIGRREKYYDFSF